MVLFNQRINISIRAEPPLSEQLVDPTDTFDARNPIRWNLRLV